MLFVPINRRHYAADPIRPVAQKLQCSYDDAALHPLHPKVDLVAASDLKAAVRARAERDLVAS